MKIQIFATIGILALMASRTRGADHDEIAWRKDGRSVVEFTIPLSEGGNLEAMFDFGDTKGFLGPSSDPGSQNGFSNADQTIIGVNHQPATKCSYVHLFLRSPGGDMNFLNNVNARVAQLLEGRWAEDAKNFLRIERISGRTITLQVIDFAKAKREDFEFTVSVDLEGEIELAE